jgi:hypothetical protein
MPFAASVRITGSTVRLASASRESGVSCGSSGSASAGSMDARRALLLGRALRRGDVRFFGSGERRTVLCATVNAVSGLPDAVHAADRES